MTRQEFLFLALISFGFFFLMNRDINSWYYSAIGDEYAFYNLARDIAFKNQNLSLFPAAHTLSVFSQSGTYDVVPVAISAYQALIMRVFGVNHQGWIIASVIYTIFSLFPFYLLTKAIFDKETALFSTIIYTLSHTVWGYNHLGYWNSYGLFSFSAALLFYLLAKRGKNQRYFIIASGIFSGLCFFTNYFSRASVFIIGLLFLIDILRGKKNWAYLVQYLVGFSLLFLPFLLVNQGGLFTSFLNRSLINTQEIPDSERLIYFFNNFTGAFVSFYKNNNISHFVSGSLLDLVSSFLLTLGFVWSLFKIKKYYPIFIGLIVLLTLIGGLSQFKHAAIERLVFILPVMAMFAGFGLKKAITYFKIKNPARSVIILGILVTIFALNYHRFYIETPQKFQLSVEAVTIGAWIKKCHQNKTSVIYNHYEPLLRPAIDSYQLPQPPKLIKNDEFTLGMLEEFDCFIFPSQNDKESQDITRVFSQDKFTTNTFSDFSRLTKVLIIKKI